MTGPSFISCSIVSAPSDELSSDELPSYKLSGDKLPSDEWSSNELSSNELPSYEPNVMSQSPPVFSTQRLSVRMATYRDVSAIVQFYQDNRSFLAPFEPTRPPEFFTAKYWQAQVERNLVEFDYDQSLRLFLFEQADPKLIIGIANFNQFFRGVFQSCTLGYGLAKTHQGKGYMYEALASAIPYMFKTLKFHRIMANYMPHNQRSGTLLRRLGFTVEGYARDYLLIDGKWEDHILTSLLNPDWQTSKGRNS